MLAGPIIMCALLLAAAGLAKLWSPTATRAALYAVGLPSSTLVVVAFALAEVAIATSVLVWGGALPAAALGLTYAGFAVFVAVGRRSGRLTNCGCFGSSGTSPGAIHITFNAAAAGVGLAAVFFPIDSVDQIVADQPWYGLPFAGVVTLGAALSYAVLTVLPEAMVYVGPSRSAAGGSS
ncbi:MAG: MauE/DoxX family redox-associated membrane protein [Acidimicrobiales bacterium]